MDVADELRRRLWFLEEENKGLRGQLEAMAQERDNLAAIVWGKIRGGPVNPMGGQANPQTTCAMCGGDCTADTPNFAYGVRYCSPCVARYTDEHILEHARGVMSSGGALVVGKNGTPLNKSVPRPTPVYRDPVSQKIAEAPFKDTTDTQIIDRSEWDAWVASLTKGHAP